MELVYYKNARGNFGDDLSPIFFNAACPGYEEISKRFLYGIGTLLNSSKGIIADSIIFGSGYGQGGAATIDKSTTDILGVRGPLTARSIGLADEDAVIGDPALYLPRLKYFNGGRALGGGKIILALHHRTAEFWNFQAVGSRRDIVYLDPAGTSVFDYIATIKSGEIILAESLHAAILAAAYGIPFMRVGLLNKVDEIKWEDFFLSLGIKTRPEAKMLPIPRESLSRKIGLALAARKILSKNRVFSNYASLAEQDLDAIERFASTLAFSGRHINASRSGVNRLQGRIEGALERLLRMKDQ